mmetsp:Transcript_82052/g.253606  ORF Transcript_82052/g.253606 Transcript_82052/m.253606 type:complete len:444 (+) Transcript_82052:369-1700(+)
MGLPGNLLWGVEEQFDFTEALATAVIRANLLVFSAALGATEHVHHAFEKNTEARPCADGRPLLLDCAARRQLPLPERVRRALQGVRAQGAEHSPQSGVDPAALLPSRRRHADQPLVSGHRVAAQRRDHGLDGHVLLLGHRLPRAARAGGRGGRAGRWPGAAIWLVVVGCVYHGGHLRCKLLGVNLDAAPSGAPGRSPDAGVSAVLLRLGRRAVEHWTAVSCAATRTGPVARTGRGGGLGIRNQVRKDLLRGICPRRVRRLLGCLAAFAAEGSGRALTSPCNLPAEAPLDANGPLRGTLPSWGLSKLSIGYWRVPGRVGPGEVLARAEPLEDLVLLSERREHLLRCCRDGCGHAARAGGVHAARLRPLPDAVDQLPLLPQLGLDLLLQVLQLLLLCGVQSPGPGLRQPGQLKKRRRRWLSPVARLAACRQVVGAILHVPRSARA